MLHSTDREKRKMEQYLALLTTINKGIEHLLGPSAKGIIFNIGVEEGRILAEDMPKTNNLLQAIHELNKAYEDVWSIELRIHKDTDTYSYIDEYGQPSYDVIIRECPIRTAVAEHGLEQGGPICYLTNGYLCGMLEGIIDEPVGMEILHAGPLACKKRLYLRMRTS